MLPEKTIVESQKRSQSQPFKTRDGIVSELKTKSLLKYYDACEKMGIKPNGSLCTLFANPSVPHFRPDAEFGLKDLVAFEQVIHNTEQVKRIDFYGLKMGPMCAHVIAQLLCRNQSITFLDLSYNDIGDVGAGVLAKALKQNKTLISLKIRGNLITNSSVDELANSIAVNESLVKLDISNNYIGSSGASKIESSASNRKFDLDLETDGNFVYEEVINSVTHGFGILIAIIGTMIMMNHADDPKFSNMYFWSCALFCVCLILLFICSTLAHSFHRMKLTGKIFVILDHSCISLVIAGTYTPFCLVTLGHRLLGPVTCAIAWLAAIAGVWVSFLGPKYQKFELLLFITMGCAVIFVMPWLYECVQSLSLLVYGGFAYIIGIYFFIRGQTEPIYHAIWHIFVLLGATLHYLAIFWDVRPCILLDNQ